MSSINPDLDPATCDDGPDLDALRERMQDDGDRLLEAIESEAQ